MTSLINKKTLAIPYFINVFNHMHGHHFLTSFPILVTTFQVQLYSSIRGVLFHKLVTRTITSQFISRKSNCNWQVNSAPVLLNTLLDKPLYTSQQRGKSVTILQHATCLKRWKQNSGYWYSFFFLQNKTRRRRKKKRKRKWTREEGDGDNF